MKTLKMSAIAGLMLASAACVQNDPEYQAQKSDRIAQAKQAASSLVDSEFTPVFPHCLAAAERGVVVSEQQMATLGFAPSFVLGSNGYSKKRGTTTIDRLNSSTTGLAVNSDSCALSLGNFGNVNEIGAFVRRSLEAEGYTQTTRNKTGFEFQKGNITLFVSGFAYNGLSTVKLKRS